MAGLRARSKAMEPAGAQQHTLHLAGWLSAACFPAKPLTLRALHLQANCADAFASRHCSLVMQQSHEDHGQLVGPVKLGHVPGSL